MQVLHQMFNVSALLLDDALKPATPLTNGAINANQLIFDEVIRSTKNKCQIYHLQYNTWRCTHHISHAFCYF